VNKVNAAKTALEAAITTFVDTRKYGTKDALLGYPYMKHRVKTGYHYQHYRHH